MFKKTKVSMAAAMLVGGASLLAGPAQAQTADQRVEITGSRIKRVDAEGSLPVVTISRIELEASGQATVAEFLRTIPFASAGNFRPQSGSSAQSFAEVNLRGLGSNRTLVLVDGRRVPKSPVVGTAADMNSIPMAAVERVEILTDGASAIYGSDAIGGVINFILRKNFDGVALMAETTRPSVEGGDREAASALFGMSSDKGRLMAGVSKSSRDIIFVRDYPWGYTRGQSTFSNNFFGASLIDGVQTRNTTFLGIAGTCNYPDRGFYINGAGAGARCRYDFNLVAADEASLSTQSVFARGQINIAKDWSLYLTASNTNNKSFGRYAPVPDNILITRGSAADVATLPATYGPGPYFLAHRFAAGGNRDTSTDGNLSDAAVGAQGTLFGLDIDMGARRSVNKVVETGRGFVVKELATAAINNGTYNFADPFNNPPELLGSFTTTTGRDSSWKQTEYYASATVDLFKLSGGSARLYLGGEYRREDYADLYDSLSESGQVLGSSGSSASGGRKVGALTAELFMPLMKGLEASIAGRFEKYSDYGDDFSPKASLSFLAMPNLKLRGSVGKGFAAPSLPELTQKPAFSADSIVDERTCLADGSNTAAVCAANTESFQINGLQIANPSLDSEKSTQFAFGFVWDVLPAVSVSADYWNVKIDGVVNAISAQTLVDRNNGVDPLPIPAGLSVSRDPITGAVIRVVRGSANEGTFKYSGVDLSVKAGWKLGGVGAFDHVATITRMLKQTEVGVERLDSFSYPKMRAVLANRWSLGSLSASWNINYIGANGGVRAGEPPRVKAYVTHDLQFGWTTPIKGVTLKVGAVNAGEKFPELITDNSKPFNYDLYDAYGRQMYLRVDAKF